jgi:hypothetical protein
MSLERLARDMVFHQMLYHPLPWRIDHDWTVEVVASDNHIIVKTDYETAREVVALAESIQKELDETNIEELINGTGTNVADDPSSP